MRYLTVLLIKWSQLRCPHGSGWYADRYDLIECVDCGKVKES